MDLKPDEAKKPLLKPFVNFDLGFTLDYLHYIILLYLVALSSKNSCVICTYAL